MSALKTTRKCQKNRVLKNALNTQRIVFFFFRILPRERSEGSNCKKLALFELEFCWNSAHVVISKQMETYIVIDHFPKTIVVVHIFS